jgi:hypothetical protein
VSGRRSKRHATSTSVTRSRPSPPRPPSASASTRRRRSNRSESRTCAWRAFLTRAQPARRPTGVGTSSLPER